MTNKNKGEEQDVGVSNLLVHSASLFNRVTLL